MKSPYRTGLYALLAAVLFILSGCAGSAAKVGHRDILWSIVDNCVDSQAPDYCAKCISPRLGTPYAAGKQCRETTEVWAENREFVVLRDRKMCGCPEGFVHGLAIPRAKVTGVEDPQRPDAIWRFAWEVATSKIGNEMEIGLAANPPGKRDQDQLHVHLVRLKGDARERFLPERSARVDRLERVWSTASYVADKAGLKEYGVLVVRLPKEGFLVVIDDGSPEKDYTVPYCR